MSEMKMSDVWPSGFSGVDFTYGFYDNAETLSGEVFKATDSIPLCGLLFNNEEPAKAVMHAINNHDRLTEELQAKTDFLALKVAECERLREALVNVLHASEMNTGHEPSLSVFHRSIDEALDLLEQTK